MAMCVKNGRPRHHTLIISLKTGDIHVMVRSLLLLIGAETQTGLVSRGALQVTRLYGEKDVMLQYARHVCCYVLNIFISLITFSNEEGKVL